MAGPECPGCNSAFDSWQKLRVHHRSAHGGRLPNRECQHCGERFCSEYEKKYCSGGCRDATGSFEGSENPNYDDAAETTTCDLCDSEFEYYPSEKKGVYCLE